MHNFSFEWFHSSKVICILIFLFLVFIRLLIILLNGILYILSLLKPLCIEIILPLKYAFIIAADTQHIIILPGKFNIGYLIRVSFVYIVPCIRDCHWIFE